MKEALGCLGAAILMGLIVLALAFAGLYVGGFFQRASLDINRENVQHSREYVQTKQGELLTLIQDYRNTNDRGQQNATRDHFCQEAQLLIRSEWTTPIAVFYDGNCG